MDNKLSMALRQAAALRTRKGNLGRLAKGWFTKNIECPHSDRHTQHDHKPSCSVKADGSLYCHRCEEYWTQRQAAALLNVSVTDEATTPNRSKRRMQAKVGRRISRRRSQRELVYISVELPKHLRKLARLILQQSVQYGTCVMSREKMGEVIGKCKRTVFYYLKELRELEWLTSTPLGHIVLRTNYQPDRWDRPLGMWVMIEAPWFTASALDCQPEMHAMYLANLMVVGKLPKFVHFPGGFSRKIQYKLHADDDDDDDDGDPLPRMTTMFL
ncbi:MAG: hypothetical protein OXE52_11580 [Chloroflexi bacterium]|nr:hypothetical protein [Chloroflexota bacterium]